MDVPQVVLLVNRHKDWKLHKSLRIPTTLSQFLVFVLPSSAHIHAIMSVYDLHFFIDSAARSGISVYMFESRLGAHYFPSVVQFSHSRPTFGLPSDVMTTCVNAHVGLGIFIDCWFLNDYEDGAETPPPVYTTSSVPTSSPVVAARFFNSSATVGLGIDVPGLDAVELVPSHQG